MRCSYLLACILCPLLVVAQSSTNGTANGSTSGSQPANTNQPQPTGSSNSSQPTNSGNSTGPTVTTITSVLTTVVLGSDRVLHTITSTNLITSTINSAQTTGGTTNGNQDHSSSSLPPPTTAPASIDGGASLPNGAPSPGATGSGGKFGPDDGYIAGALAHHANVLLVAFAGIAAGGALVVL